MSNLLLEKIGRVRWGYNVFLTYNFSENILPVLTGTLKIFDDHVEFKELWTTRKLNIPDIDSIELKPLDTLFFEHHADTIKFLSFTCFRTRDKEDILKILKSLNIKIKE